MDKIQIGPNDTLGSVWDYLRDEMCRRIDQIGPNDQGRLGTIVVAEFMEMDDDAAYAMVLDLAARGRTTEEADAFADNVAVPLRNLCIELLELPE